MPGVMVAGALAIGGVLAFWAGVLLAISQYPTTYDWYYMPVSNLFSASHNPNGYIDAEAGVVICSLACMGWIGRSARRDSVGARALLLGALAMAYAAALPPSLLPLRKGHELLALSGFAGTCLGVVLLTFQVIEQWIRRRLRGAPGAAGLSAGFIAACAVAPVICAGVAQAYVFYALPALHWVSLSWRARGVPVYLSFAFWEWVTCVVLSLYLLFLVVAIGMAPGKGLKAV